MAKRQHFELKDGTSSKFWEIEIAGRSHTVRFGRVGKSGQTRTKEFTTASEARGSRDKLIRQKVAKGYKQTDASGTDIVQRQTTSSAKPRAVPVRPLLKKVTSCIEKLGGSYKPPKKPSLAMNMSAIRFSSGLYFRDWDGNGIDSFLNDHPKLLNETTTKIADRAEKKLLSTKSHYGSKALWQCHRLRPFSQEEKEFVDLTEIREYAGDGPLDFLQIVYVDAGYPDQHFICLQDPKPGNPTVFGTDHEVSFQEYYGFTPLSDFLAQFMTPKQFRKSLEEHIEFYAERMR